MLPPQPLEVLHQHLFDLLVRFDRFCKDYDVEYWLDGGTLLGGVRHRGFIPWDDDMDVSMTPENRTKVEALADAGKLKRYGMHKTANPVCLCFADSRDERAQVDIFMAYTLKKSRFMPFCHAVDFMHSRYVPTKEKLINHLFRRPINKRLYRMGRALTPKIMGRASVPRAQADLLWYGSPLRYNKSVWPIDAVFPLTEIQFEHRQFPAPKNHDAYLRSLYGDYMLVPSPGQRKMHARIHGYVPAASDQRIRVYTSGVFDLFHAGHVRALKLAADQGTWLVVGITSDESCAEYKRIPMISYEQRWEMVAACKYVDEVIEAPNYPDAAFYKKQRIDLAIQGEDTPGFDFYEVPKSLGIIKFVGYQDITNTSAIIKHIRGE